MSLRSLRAAAAVTALASAALTGARPAPAQTTVIDAGSFRIAIRGSDIGTESFTIRQSGSGANVTTVAQGRLILDTGEQTRTVFQFQGPDRRPAAYQIEVSGDARQNISGRAAGNRFRATILSSSGEQMREYLFDERAIILHDGLAHPLYFLAHRASHDASIPVILPHQSRQASARVRDRGTETIVVADQQVEARHLEIEIDGLHNRSLWVDSRNRVLRLRIPQQDLTAVRTALP